MFKPLFAAVCLLALLPCVCRAESSSQVTALGSAVIVRIPETIRMNVELTGEGTDMKEALAALNMQREAFKKRLLATSPASSNFSEPEYAGVSDLRRQQMEYMMRGRNSNATPAPVRLSQAVKAEWPLTGKTAEERLLNAAAIQDQLKAPTPPKKTETPTTQSEEQEEAAALAQAGSQPTSATPTFTYVAPLKETDHVKAISDAFNKAKITAGRMAAGVGGTLGTPVDIKMSISPTRDAPADSESAYVSLILGESQKSTSTLAFSDSEAVGPQPSVVSITLTVTASFSLSSK